MRTIQPLGQHISQLIFCLEKWVTYNPRFEVVFDKMSIYFNLLSVIMLDRIMSDAFCCVVVTV